MEPPSLSTQHTERGCWAETQSLIFIPPPPDPQNHSLGTAADHCDDKSCKTDKLWRRSELSSSVKALMLVGNNLGGEQTETYGMKVKTLRAVAAVQTVKNSFIIKKTLFQKKSYQRANSLDKLLKCQIVCM